jgi:hypothetical protein
MRSTFLGFLGVLLLLTPSTAIAQKQWNATAQTCVPLHTAIQNDLYKVIWTTVSHKDQATGTITLYCPIPANIISGSSHNLQLRYQDDGQCPECTTAQRSEGRVVAEVVRFDVRSGNLARLAQVSSDNYISCSDCGKPRWGTSEGFYHTFESINSIYYVRIDITRNNPTRIVGVAAIAIS